ncbi:methionyl-tRNA formyltransferase [Sporanaerobium hydrogeniformans]|uniref:Methionyl-tRNA formyltransferase n=1 Tax=Sporanaerobium hydrogeniformans TaxID=3072179 RepID=A0AC61DAC0_9FIRM|nr:formyltransferase family protein [Sporanaerobium hydrogeniformans]PHV70170.1 methionyl-tRNA formyltransferase [Sporanaerobium hydrogeniformans]
MKNIGFYLLNEKGYTVLKAVLTRVKNINIEFVAIGQDVEIENDYSLEIKNLCEENGINYYWKNYQGGLFDGYVFAIGWRWMINGMDNNKLIVLHDSLLPRYRGFNPLVSCLINGEEYIGVTALYASDKYDRGNIIMQRAISVTYPIKIKDAIASISILYADIVVELIEEIKEAKLIAYAQDEEQATYSLWRDEQDYYIDWEWDSHKIRNFVDAVGSPYKGAHTRMNDRIIVITEVEIYPDVVIENRTPGKIIFMEDSRPIVVCGKGLIKIIHAHEKVSKEDILGEVRFRTRFI